MPPKRMTANPARPLRHRAGKPTNQSDSNSDSDLDAASGDDELTPPEPPKKRTIAPPPKLSGPGRVPRSIGAAAAQAVRPNDEAARKAAAAKNRAELEQKAREDGFVTESEEGDDESDSQSSSGGGGSERDEEEASDQSSRSDDEEEPTPRRPVMLRPKFLSKAKRDALQQQRHPSGGASSAPRLDQALVEEDDDDEEQEKKEGEKEEKRRRVEVDALVEAQIQKDLAARAAGKKHWDDDEASAEEIDDTDDLDPAAEYAAWRLREIKRIVRARQAIEAKEKELLEKERRQNLPEEQRRAEDEALLTRQRKEKEGRGKMGFLQKYYHKGAFYQDESAKKGLNKRDIMGARFADEVRSRELLPAALQMRDMTKLGKKGATKYKDLKSEDTGEWGRFGDPQRQRSEWDRYGGGDGRGDARSSTEYGAKGANAVPLGQRRERREGSKEDREKGGKWMRDMPRSRSPPRRRDRSRSRSPSPRRRDRDDYRRIRKREYSHEQDRHDGDKRRRG